MNVDCVTHVPNCRKGHCKEIHKIIITILLKYRLSFTFLFDNFPIISHRFYHRPVSLSTIYAWFAVLTSDANTLTREKFELQHPPFLSPMSFTMESCLDNYALWTLPPLQLIALDNSWRGQFKCGVHEMCWKPWRIWNQWRTEGGGFKHPLPKFRSFDKVEPDCKLSRKCLVFLFQHPN
jgi:hypothetical protein